MYYSDNDYGYEPTSEDLQDWQAVKSTARRCHKCEEELPDGYHFFCCENCRQKPLEPQTATCTITSPSVDDFDFLRSLDGRDTPKSNPDPDPFVSPTKEGPFWAPIYVFPRKSGQRLELDSKQYAELVNSQK